MDTGVCGFEWMSAPVIARHHCMIVSDTEHTHICHCGMEMPAKMQSESETIIRGEN